ncbi:hypothetical protein FQA39_LY17592 [Lamprigera yunnana]|nr:hypothetical protein FQA39_LY17592 [Lamprigera yunnana]
MFPTFISILDIQSWWEVPSIAHFCSLFRTAFNLLDFDIEDLEEALLTDGTEETSWLQELIVRLLTGCLPNNEISTFNYQMFLRRLFREKCKEHDRYNPFNTDIDFQLLPLRTKVDILHALCDFRLDADDVLEQLKNLEADSLRVEPLGYDNNESAYWYFYGTRLYREDFKTKNNKKGKSVWQVVCFTEDDWFQLAKKFKKSQSKCERQLYRTLTENFLPELPRLFCEKERLARKRLLEKQPRRTSSRLGTKRKQEIQQAEKIKQETITEKEREVKDEVNKKKELERRRQEAYERRSRIREQDNESENVKSRYEMAGDKKREKKYKPKQRHDSNSSSSSRDCVYSKIRSSSRNKSNIQVAENNKIASSSTNNTTGSFTVGRQTNNSLASATGQIVIQPVTNTNRKKLKTSLVFRQTEEDLQTGMHKILDYVKNHEDAWPFVDPVEEEYAPNYYSVIRKPMDLQRMEERLDSGYYKNFSRFRGDFQLIVDNCRLYNGVDNEYTEMVGNLLTVFEKATERYLDQITSSDEEIAIEYSETDLDEKVGHNKRISNNSECATVRKPTLVAQIDKKRESSASDDSVSKRSNSVDSSDKLKNKKKLTKSKIEEIKVKKNIKPGRKKVQKNLKVSRKSARLASSPIRCRSRTKSYSSDSRDSWSFSPSCSPSSPEEKVFNVSSQKINKHSVASDEENKFQRRKKVQKNLKVSRKSARLASSPIRCRSRTKSYSSDSRDSWSFSPSCSPSSPEEKVFNVSSQKINKHSVASDEENKFQSNDKLSDKWKGAKNEEIKIEVKTQKTRERSPSPLKQKDKHNKLRETIEKLKAKSEILNKLKDEDTQYLQEEKIIQNVENVEIKNKKFDLFKNKFNCKAKNKVEKRNLAVEGESSSDDSLNSENKRYKKKENTNIMGIKNAAIEALTLATEQTLKDINKWLDDTPRLSEFSSASNSPSHYIGAEEFDNIGNKIDNDYRKRLEKPIPRKEAVAKDIKRRTFNRDPVKFLKKREVQRTIDRLQPGKSKGNLLSNVQNVNKADDLYTLGPLSKVKDTKNSLIVKTDEATPKLSLGSVLDSFGKHKFVDDIKKDEDKDKEPILKKIEPVCNKEDSLCNDKIEVKVCTATDNKIEANEANTGKATPNLSAWFKAFGAPKVLPIQKKLESKFEIKENEKSEDVSNKELKKEDVNKVLLPDVSPNSDNPVAVQGQPIPRQRKMSTGSTISERSSFSQDMDSPRIGIDERLGAYPAPYPSPLHRSPSGASPVMASPRPDVSPKSTYPTVNGQIRVGFYQDTVSTKSSPDKSCSPQSSYQQYSEHVYTPTTTETSTYSYSNPYYSQLPNYTASVTTPSYNAEQSSSTFYDTNKPLTDQYRAKSAPNYSTNYQNIHSPRYNAPTNSPNYHSVSSPTQSVTQLPSPSFESYQQNQQQPNSQQLAQPLVQQQQPQQQQTQQQQTQQQSHSPRLSEKLQQPTVFPVKKRAYNESESVQIIPIQNQQDSYDRNYELSLISGRMESGSTLSQNPEIRPTSRSTPQHYVPQNIPNPRPSSVQSQQSSVGIRDTAVVSQSTLETLRSANYVTSANLYNYSSETPYAISSLEGPLDLNSRSENADKKLEMSKYTNMGYVNNPSDVAFNKNSPYGYGRNVISGLSNKNSDSSNNVQDTNEMMLRYAEATDYRSTDINLTQPSKQLLTQTSENLPYKTDMPIPRAGYSTSASLNMGNISNLTHIVDRFSENVYYDKNLAATHIYNKPITSTSSLPIFSQPYSHDMQAQATQSALYNRQLTELQSSKTYSQQSQQAPQPTEKKSKRRKSIKTFTPTTSIDAAASSASNQGFQSYSGLKNTSTMEPSAISLKTASVVPGSAFNFGPTPTGLGLSSGLYGEKDAYSNFLEDYRATPNYYMAAAAAAAHHRSADAGGEKQVRSTHQATPSAASGYPFISAPQPRPPSYSFMSPHQAPPLMDASSPLYQQYLQAGVLHQGLLGPPGAYPPGYHPALSMRQPFDSMTRPSWL